MLPLHHWVLLPHSKYSILKALSDWLKNVEFGKIKGDDPALN
jgi:hypothetical protein